MKSIRTFVRSKVRRAEVGAQVRVDESPGPHEQFGPAECRIETQEGSATFFEGGLVVGDRAFAYRDVRGLERGLRPDGTRLVRVNLQNGDCVEIVVSLEGGTVLYDSLRWIGRALFRQRWDEPTHSE